MLTATSLRQVIPSDGDVMRNLNLQDFVPLFLQIHLEKLPFESLSANWFGMTGLIRRRDKQEAAAAVHKLAAVGNLLLKLERQMDQRDFMFEKQV